MKTKYLKRIYEAIALLFMLVCVGQILWGAPNYDAQLSELKTAMNQSWQLENQKVVKDMANLHAEVCEYGNSKENMERIQFAKLLIKKTRKVDSILNQAHNNITYSTKDLEVLQKVIKNYKQWLNVKLKHLELVSIESQHILTKSLTQHHTTTIAIKALISEKKLYIQHLQAMVLHKLGVGNYIENNHFGEYLRVRIIPQLQKIQVGSYHEADIIIYGSASYTKPRLSIANTPLLIIDEESKVVLKPQSIGTQCWEAKLCFRSNCKDTTIVHKIYYEVK